MKPRHSSRFFNYGIAYCAFFLYSVLNEKREVVFFRFPRIFYKNRKMRMKKLILSILTASLLCSFAFAETQKKPAPAQKPQPTLRAKAPKKNLSWARFERYEALNARLKQAPVAFPFRCHQPQAQGRRNSRGNKRRCREYRTD